jgi:hypothetical protein
VARPTAAATLMKGAPLLVVLSSADEVGLVLVSQLIA